VKIVRVPFPDEGNDLHPLVPDYYDLTTEGQRQARVNGCRQWLINQERRPDAYVAALWFFTRWYLWPDPAVEFDPLFYDDTPCESPDYHWMVARQWISWRMNMTIAPRGGAKSYLNCQDILLRNTTRPAYSFTYATSTHPNAREVGERLKRQWLFNDRLNDDWRPEFPDERIIPKRGEGTFSTEHMVLNNASWVRLLSAESRQRGGRPRRYRLDDPEYDPKASTSMSVLREYMRTLLFKVIVPMVTRPDTGVDWIGTYVSKRHFLWHAMQVEDTPEGERAKDPRFNRWSRLHIPAAVEDSDGKLISCWEEMWPATKQQRIELVATDKRFEGAMSLEEIRVSVGRAVFESEFMGRPGDSTESYFPLNTSPRGPQAYWYEDVDDLFGEQPWLSETKICWVEERKGEPSTKKMPIKEFLTEYARAFITADTSNTATKDSDYKVAACDCITPNNDLFVLDLWAHQAQETALVKAIFQMAARWRVPSIHPEVVSGGRWKGGASLFHSLLHIVSTKAEDVAGTSFLPAVRKLDPRQIEKSQKISSQLFRFEHNKVKLPMWKRDQPPWQMLFEQIEDFNPDVEDGGLQFDDCIETAIAMPQFVLKGRLNRPPPPEESGKPLAERLRDGEFRDPDGTHIGHGLDLRLLTYQDVQEILEARVHGTSVGTSKI
jgi:hypothetical protein